MKRVNLLSYFEIAESLYSARTMLALDTAKAGFLYFRLDDLNAKLIDFVKDDSAFSVCKHPANDLLAAIEHFRANFTSSGGLSLAKLDEDLESWKYSHILAKVDHLKSVFAAECNDVSIYSVEQVSIYKTSDLVETGSKKIAQEILSSIPAEIVNEFDNAGKALAFDLPTACGFHVLRALEIMMDYYLQSFHVTKKSKSWNDTINAMKRLEEQEGRAVKPSKKVIAMLDRMRQLDRNPLMHPRDVLDLTQAETLFSLCAITITEMARDLNAKSESLSGLSPLVLEEAA